ncbi:MAG: hypothetical protein QOE89_2513, partial [Pseudonocardiales bacterium]|nr:hypothetical protein [Pseudonocardiales bacterium]
GGVTYAIIETPARGLGSIAVLVTGTIGLLCLVAFGLAEARQRNPMLPLTIFGSAQFSAANAVTFLVYGAFGGVFFLLVVELQVVAGFSPIAAGTALLPVTVVMLLLSSRGGQLAQRIGPRLPMTLGPLICAGAVLLMLRIGPGAGYLTEVVPAVLVLGFGLALLVAPLTATVLAAVDVQHAGVASGVNNAVARAAGLIAVAALPAVAGLSGTAYDSARSFQHGFRIVLITCAGLLVLAAALAAATIRNTAALPEGRERPLDVTQCAITGPSLAGTRAAAASGSTQQLERPS